MTWVCPDLDKSLESCRASASGAECVDVVQWFGVAVVTGKSAQAVVASASSTKAPATSSS